MSTKLFGAPIPRRLDDRLVKGEGRFLDDLSLPKLVHVAFLRSTHASAGIASLDTSAARAIPGVIDIVSHHDLGPAGQPFPQLLPHHGLADATWSALAPGRVCFVGEAIAAVAAESLAAAVQAVEAIEVEYSGEEPVLDVEAAIRPGSRLVHPQVPRNIAMHLVENCGDVEAALRNAPHRLKERFRITRGGGMPLEPRGLVADYDVNRQELTVWSSTQEPHTVRNIVADLLGLPRHRVRVIAPDTGGGFGTKLNVYPEEVVIPWLALRLGRPVKWVETRSEHMLSATQEREQIHDIEVGFDDKGTLLGLKNSFFHDMGAFAPRGGAVPHNTSAALIGPYRIPNVRSEIFAVYTNTATVSAYRGAGQPQGVFVIERTMDRIAAHLGRDPVEVRLLNTIRSDAFPYDTGLTNLLGGAVEYESGDFVGTLEKALAAADYAGLRAKQAEARKAGRHYGIGIANYVELTGRGPWEGGGVRVEPDGSATVYTGAPGQGQGHETTLAQVCADYLGISIDKVKVLAGDTALIPHGIGTFASRVGVLASNAVRLSAVQVKDKILRIASDMLEASAADLVVEDGRVFITGVPDKGLSFAEIAKRAQRAASKDDEEPGLEAVRYFKTSNITYSNGTHIVTVDVDVETGMVRIDDYVIAHDCGRLINPLIVEGQILGGVACGIGNSLLEEHVYNADGQLLSGSFMDYAMPLALHMPDEVKIVHQETPSTLNPLGVKGVGEAGTIPVPAVICNAVEDALKPLNVKITVAPLTPSRLWKIIQSQTGLESPHSRLPEAKMANAALETNTRPLKKLAAEAVAQFERDGFYSPIRAIPAAEAIAIRAKLEAHEKRAGGPLEGSLRHKSHLLFPWLWDLVHHRGIVDAVEDILGPNLLCWSSSFFIKEARDPAFVSWHQDSTYWGLSSPDVVTAWVALSSSTLESGAMRVVPKTHAGQVAHRDTFKEGNLLTRGQEVMVDIDGSNAVDLLLEPGEMSLHHVRLIHGSEPNRAADRRIGYAIRYIPTTVRQTVGPRDSATFVRGVDEYHHFDHEKRPEGELSPDAVAQHHEIAERQARILYAGTPIQSFDKNKAG